MFIGFVHGMRQTGSDWGLLSPMIAGSLDADYHDFKYKSGFFSRVDAEGTVRTFETDLLTKTRGIEEMYLVGYSLGGLIIRKLLADLYSGFSDQPELLEKIRGLVTIGTPLHGPKKGYMSRCPKMISPWTSFIGQQSNAKKRIPFAAAIKKSKLERRPMFHHIQFQDDEWVARHNRSHYTSDDLSIGMFPGGHTDIDRGERGVDLANFVTDELRKTASANPRGRPATPKPVDNEVNYTSIILVSCSATKTAVGAVPWQAPKPGAWLPSEELRQELLARRSRILDAIKNSQVEDVTYGQGNRGDKISNKSIIAGPDFGFMDTGKDLYLPSLERYKGRLYKHLSSVDWEKFYSQDERPLILIMSGLYGLVDSREFIQDYDVHLSDIENNYGAPLKGLWNGWMTKSLNSLVSKMNGKTRIINLMAEDDYTDAISWHALDRDECSVFHLVGNLEGREIRGRELLTPAGAVLSGIVRKPGRELTLSRSDSEHSYLYSLAEFADDLGSYGELKFTFERAVSELEGKINWEA